MSNNAIYLAGFPAKYPEEKTHHMEMVCCTRERRPYLTHHENGLKLTRHHANLYVLSCDHSKVRCVQASYNSGVPKRPIEITLSAEDQTRIQEAINTNYFFN